MLARKVFHYFLKRISDPQHSRFAAARYTALVTLASLLVCSLPAPVTGAVLRDTITVSSAVAYQAQGALASWVRFLSARRTQGNGMPQGPGTGEGITPTLPASKADKEAAVAAIQVNPAGEVILQSDQPMLFAAIPVDNEGIAIQGLVTEWSSTNSQVVFVDENGEAVAGRTGTAILTAAAGRVRENVRVTVVEGSKEPFGGKKKQNSRRPERAAASNADADANTGGVKVARKSQQKLKRAHPSERLRAETAKVAAPSAPMFLRDINDDPLPDDETGSLFSPTNGVGSPPGRTTTGALTPGTATDGTESPGSANFNFEIPVVNLPGRGINLALNLVYNSRAYNKSTSPFNGFTWMTYDVDSGWPAAGFRLGFGQIEDQGSLGFTLTDADGTRHLLVQTSTNNYDSQDGTFIHFTGGSGWGSLFYADGTRVDYGAAGGAGHVP